MVWVHPSRDVNGITVGSGTNIQDNSLVHVAKSNLSGKVLATIIGDNVTIGHSAVIYGCTIEDGAFVGMRATLLDGVVVEKHAMVSAGSLVRQDTRVPFGEVWAGNPAKFLRKLVDEEIAFISQSATNYINLAKDHAAENATSPLTKLSLKRYCAISMLIVMKSVIQCSGWFTKLHQNLFFQIAFCLINPKRLSMRIFFLRLF